MQRISKFDEINLSEKIIGFLKIFLDNISKINNIEKIILFGSRARGDYNENSDIDIFVVTKEDASIEEEIYIMAECPPDMLSEFYIENDIIIKTEKEYNQHKKQMGMVQKYVEMEGIDLTELLQERSR